MYEMLQQKDLIYPCREPIVQVEIPIIEGISSLETAQSMFPGAMEWAKKRIPDMDCIMDHFERRGLDITGLTPEEITEEFITDQRREMATLIIGSAIAHELHSDSIFIDKGVHLLPGKTVMVSTSPSSWAEGNFQEESGRIAITIIPTIGQTGKKSRTFRTFRLKKQNSYNSIPTMLEAFGKDNAQVAYVNGRTNLFQFAVVSEDECFTETGKQRRLENI